MDNLFDDRWRAVQREAQLAASQIGLGATLLRKANHAQTGLYTQAFFALSIGLERAGKLVFMADHAISHDGTLPTDEDLRKVGHDIAALLPMCEAVGARISPQREFAAKPDEPVHRAIVAVLSEFAKRSRYFNLNFLTGARVQGIDPIAMWWEKVGMPMLEMHYSPRQRQRDANHAQALGPLLDSMSITLHSDEAGNPIRSAEAMMRRAGATRVIQRYGQFYVLQIARWLGSLITALQHEGAYKHRIGALLGLEGPFDIFVNEDSYLRGRKTWPIYP